MGKEVFITPEINQEFGIDSKVRTTVARKSFLKNYPNI